MKVIAYIQALTQVILNITSTNFKNSKNMDSDLALKFSASTISSLSEYLFNQTFKIQKAATSAIKLVITHGLGKIKNEGISSDGFERCFMTIKYFLSTRFTEISEDGIQTKGLI